MKNNPITRFLTAQSRNLNLLSWRRLAFLPMLLASAPLVFGTANYVYHEQTGNDVTGGAANTCGGAQAFVPVLAPNSSQAYLLRFKVEYQFGTDTLKVYYTTDGSNPSGALGVGAGTTQVLSGGYQCTFTFGGNTIDLCSNTIPAQARGTVVKYIISARLAASGPEIFANSGTCGGCGDCENSACATVFQYTVSGSSLFWDADGSGVNCGGAGPWDTSSSVWSLTSCTGPYQAWNNANVDSAVFGGITGANITPSGNITVNLITATINQYALGTSGSPATPVLTFAGVGAGIAANFSSGVMTLNYNYTGSVLNKSGTGRVDLNNAVNTIGKYNISGGFVTIAAINRLGTAPASLVSDYFTFNGGGIGYANAAAADMGSTRGVTVGPNGAFFGASAAANPLTISGPITGSGGGGVTVTTGSPLYSPYNVGGTWTISNTGNNWNGPTTVSGGTLKLGASGVIPDTSTLTVSLGTLDLSTFNETVGAVNLTGGTISGSGGILTGSDYQFQSGTASAPLAGSAGITKTTTGSATVSATNTFTGKSTIANGVLIINSTSGSDTALGTAPVSLVADQLGFDGGGAIQLGSGTDITIGATRGVTLKAGGGKIQGTSKILTVASPITGPGSLTKVGDLGNITLSGINTFQGDFLINGGGVRFNSDAAAGMGTVVVTPAAIVTLRNLAPTITSTLTNPITLNANNTFDIDLTAATGNNFALSGKISGVGYMTRGRATGASGTVALTGDNSGWSGGLLHMRGTLALGHKNALGTGLFNLTAPNNATPDNLFVQATNVPLVGANAIATPVCLNTNVTFNGLQPIELSGPTVISNLTRTITNTVPVTLSGVISGASPVVGLVKAGSSVLTLANANTYSGGTTVAEGTLRVANVGGSATGPGPVTVLPGAVLSGPGSIAGALAVNGAIAPGSSPGTMNTGDESWNSGGSYVWEVNDATGGQGSDPGWDFLNVNGTLTIGATPSSKFTIKITSLNLADGPGNAAHFNQAGEYFWTIATASSGVAGTFDPASFNLDTSSFSNPFYGTWSIGQSGNNIQLHYFVPAPVITCPPNVLTVCGAGVPSPATDSAGFSTQGGTISSVCAGTITVSSSDATAPGTCVNDFTITRTYTVSDSCGGPSSTCVQTIRVHDGSAPSITCPANRTVECGSPVAPATDSASFIAQGGTISENCAAGVTVSSSDATTPGACAGTMTIVRTYTVADACDNRATCAQTITVQDTTPAMINCGQNENLECGLGWGFTVPIVTDACDSNPTLTAFSTATNFTCGTHSFVATRVWKVVDCSMNVSWCTQVVTVVDNTPPNVTCPNDMTVGCLALIPPPDTTSVSATDPCNDSVPTVTFVGDSTNGTSPVIVTRTYKATDACNNSRNCTQTFTVNDSTPPSITINGGNSGLTNNTDSGQCSAAAVLNVVAMDNCAGVTLTCIAGAVTLSQSCTNSGTTNTCQVSGTFPKGTTTVTCTASDAGGNTANASFDVTVVDNQGPTILCSNTKIVECGSNWGFDAPTASDNCPGPVTIAVLGTVTNTIGFCGHTFEATRTWSASDGAGNSNSCSQRVLVQDMTVPTVTCAPDRTVECGTAWTFDVPTGSDTCGGVTVTMISAVTNSTGCGNNKQATATWEIRDDCGNVAMCTQVVTTTDTTPPTLTCAPGKTLECGTPWGFNAPSASDSCGAAHVSILGTVTNHTGHCGSTFDATRTWVATDDCNNGSICTQMVTVVDTAPPVIAGCPTGFNVNNDPGVCTAVITYNPTAMDTCAGSVPVICTPPSGTAFPKGSVMVNCSASDGCGNSDACMFVVTVSDNEPPSITCPADIGVSDSDNNGSEVVNYTTPTPTDNCGGATASCTPPSGTAFPVGSTTVTCTATDTSTNTRQCVFTVLVCGGGQQQDVFVDDDYAGHPNGSTLGGHVVGCDAFATLQAGVNAVAPGGTVHVAAGRYPELVIVSTPMTLLGANAGVDPRTTCAGAARGPESIIDGMSTETAIQFDSSGITMDGFTIANGGGPDLAAQLYSGLHMGNFHDDNHVLNNIFTNNSFGVWANCVGPMATEIRKNRFDANDLPSIVGGAGISADGSVNLVVADNEFRLHTTVNPVLWQAGDPGAHMNMLFTGNYVHDNNCGCSAVYVLGLTNSIISSNRVASDATGIRMASGNLSVSIANNFLISGTVGVRLIDDGYGFPANNNIRIHGNSFGALSAFAVSRDAGNNGSAVEAVVDASANWWGDNTLAGIQAKLGTADGPIDFTPWLDSGAEVVANVCDGFQGDFSVLDVDDDSPQSGSGGRIQEGINLIADGSFAGGNRLLKIQPGTYPEVLDFRGIWVNKALTMLGVGGAAATRISGTVQYMVMVDASDVTLEGLTVTDPTYNLGHIFGGDGTGIYINWVASYSNVHITDCEIHDTGERSYAITAGSGPNLEIDHCKIFNIHGYPFTPGGVNDFSDDVRGIFVWNNFPDNVRIHDNQISGIDPLDFSIGISLTAGAHSADVRQNEVTLDPACFAGIRLSPSLGSGSITIASNAVSGAQFGLQLYSANGQMATNNMISGASTASIAVADASATIKGNSASPGTPVGVWASGASTKVLIENNSLTSHTEAAIKVDTGATVDAGDCTDSNVTGLGTGSQPNGSSAGGNDLTGYGFDNAAPWAVEDLNTSAQPDVLAQKNSFGAGGPGNHIEYVLYDDTDTAGANSHVRASQATLSISCPPSPSPAQCVSSAQAPATTLDQFAAYGGASSSTEATVAHSDSPSVPGPNDGTITRSYTLTDAPCGQSAACMQAIPVDDTTGPSIACGNVPPQSAFANGSCSATVPDVRALVLAESTDNCTAQGSLTATQVPMQGSSVSGAGSHPITVTVSDGNGNSSDCIVSFTVIDNTKPVVHCPADVNACSPSGGSVPVTFTVTATDNCDPSPSIVCDHASGSNFPVGSTPVVCAATDASGNTSLPCTFNVVVHDTSGPVSTTYVDDGYTGLPDCTSVDWPYTGAPGPHIIGYDAFATIQGGYTKVTAGGTVNVAPGNYAENLSITKRVNLLGAKNGVDARGRVVGAPDPSVESIVTTAVANSAIIDLNTGSADTIIDGFVFSGGGGAGTIGAIRSSSNPIDRVQILNNHMILFKDAAIWFNRGGIDITIARNVMDGSGMTAGSQILFFNGPQTFAGMQVVCNWVQNGGTRAGLFIDGDRTWNASVNRSGQILQNVFANNNVGVNSGSRSLDTVLVAMNTFTNNAFDGWQGGPKNSMVVSNLFVNNGRWGLAFTSFGNTTAGRGAFGNAVTCNTFTGNGFTIAGGSGGILFSATQPAGNGPLNRFNFNNIFGNTTGFVYTGSETIDAKTNWWGSPTGPTVASNPGGTGDIILGSTVAYNPFLRQDNTFPFIACPGDITQNTDPGMCNAVVTFTSTADSACCGGALTVVCTPASGSTFPVGTNAVNCSTTNSCGNSASCSFNVIVRDQEAPGIVCPANIVTNTAPGLCSRVVNFSPASSDNCTNVTVVCTPASGFAFPAGTTTVNCTATDGSSNSSMCSFTVKVSDQQAPTLTCPGNVTVNCTEPRDPYAAGMATATDACGPVSVTYDDDRSGLTNCNASGVIVRTWTARDSSSNVSTCMQTVTVIDTMPPMLVCPANILQANDSNMCSAVVNYTSPIGKDVCYDQGFEDARFVSGAFFDENTGTGNPSTDWNDSNSHLTRVPSGTGGIVSRSGTAHGVIDSTVLPPPPSDYTGIFGRLGGYSRVFGTGFRVGQDVYIDLSDPSVVNATATTGYAWDLASAASRQDGNHLRDFIFHTAAYDNTGVEVAADNNTNFARRNDLRSLTNHFKISATGWYTFEWVFRNNGGVLAVDMNVRNSSGTLLFTQTLSNPGDLIASVVGGNRYIWFTFVGVNKLAIDNTVLERNTSSTCSPVAGSTFPLGSTTVTCDTSDACGNATNCTFTVTVFESNKPVITCPTNLVVECGSPTDPAHTGTATATDACDPNPVITHSDSTATEVTPGNMDGWALTTTDGSGGPGDTQTAQMVNGPGTPPLGTGSARLAVGANGDGAAQLRNSNYAGTPLRNLTDLQYSTYRTMDGSGGQMVYIVLNVSTTGGPTRDDALFFEPVYQNPTYNPSLPNQGSPATGVWQSWNALAGGWWSGNGNAGLTPGTGVKSLAEYIAAYPNATIVNDTAGGGVRLVAGFGAPDWDNFDGNADAFTIGVSGVSTTYDFDLTPGNTCPTVSTIVRTWTATTTSSNQASCVQLIRLIDTTAPTITCAPNQTVECNAPFSFTTPTANDACEGTNVTISMLHTVVTLGCGSTFTATRTWSASDSCGNSNTCSQTVSVVDTTPPVITCASNKTVECGAAWSFNPPSAIDACGTNTITIVSTVTNATCGHTFTATRTWKATDVCNNASQCSQTVTVVDTVPPTVTCAPNATVECGAAWSFTPPTGTDTCAGTDVIIATLGTVTNGGCGNTFTATRTWSVSDGCGNSNTCSQMISVVDTTPPSLTCAPDKTMECTISWNFNAPSASDTCGNVAINIISTVTNTTGFCGNTFSATRTWSASDSCGNSNVCSQTVTVVDTTAPTIVCVASKTVECGTPWTFDAPSASDTCGTNTITIDGTVTNALCGNTFSATRTWRATDACNNSSTCNQTVTVVDTTAPTITCVASKTVECGTPWTFDRPSATDLCDGTNVTITITGTTTNALCGNTFSATRTWTATDSCTNSSVCSQTVTVVDTTPPVITCVPGKTVECGIPWTFDAPSATDICDGTNVTITITGTVTNALCGNTFRATRTWQATDSCTNSSVCSQTVTVVDTRPPVMSCFSSKTVECGTAWTFDRPTANDLCDGTNVTITTIGTVTNALCGNTFTATRTWNATDGCANGATCSQAVTVVDTTPPTITCPANIVTGNDPGLCSAVVTYSPTASDTCGSVTTQCTPASGSTFVRGTTTVTCRAVDSCNNTNTCTFTVTVNDTEKPVLCTNAPVVLTSGTIDNFVGPEPTSPSAALSEYLDSLVTQKRFDECVADAWLAHSFTNLPAHISSAKLRFKVQACSGTPENDTISLVFAKPGGVLRPERWIRTFGRFNGVDGLFGSATWSPGSVREFEVDLGALPNGDGTFTNLIPVLREERSLDILIVDDTEVDYLQLVVENCQCGPDMVVCKQANTNGAVVVYPQPAFTDNCGAPTVTCSPASGSFFPTGDTLVICTASDAAGNQGKCAFIVRVLPQEATPTALTIERQGNYVEISWPATCVNYQLQSTTSLHPVNWTPVAEPVVYSGGRYRVIVPITGAATYFRLQRP